MSSAQPLLASVRALVKRYGAALVVDGVDLEVAPGEIVGLLGPNGAGKTTTLECLLGLRAPDSGKILLDDIDVRTRPMEARRRVGAQIQPAAFQDKITPREALAFFASFYRDTLPSCPLEGGASPSSPRSRLWSPPSNGNGGDRAPPSIASSTFIGELLARFALSEKADAPFDSLSAGQRQRLSVALAFANRPALLVLDEPTTGLDPHARRALHRILEDHRADGGGVLLSTHDLDEAQRLCDRVAILHRGRVVATAAPAELIARAGTATRIVFQTARPLGDAAVSALPSVVEASTRDALSNGSADHHQLRTTEPARTIAALTGLLQAERNELRSLEVLPPTLEDAFVALTGEGWDTTGEAGA